MCSEAPRTSGTGVPHGIQRATREDGRDQVRGISSRLDLAVLYFCIRVACFPRHIRIMDCSLLCCAWRCRFTLPQGMSIGSAINNVHVNPVTPDPCATRAVEGSSEGSSNSRSPMAGLKDYLATRLNMLAIQKSKMFGDWQVKLDADGDHLVYFHSEFPEEKVYSNPLLSFASLKRHLEQVNGETVRYLSSETARGCRGSLAWPGPGCPPAPPPRG